MRTLNLGILAHVDAGKTSLTERLLHSAGVIHQIGSVDAGTSHTDFLELERRRGITIQAAVVSFVVGDVTINLLDTPGHPDFIAEVERALAVLDGAVLVISAVEGVQAQTRILMRTLQRLGIPTVLFVNKIDRVGAQESSLLQSIGERLTSSFVAMGTTRDLGSRAADFAPFESTELDLTPLGDHDDGVLAALVGEVTRLRDLLLDALVAQTAQAKVHPLYFGSALTGAGVDTLLDGITWLLPAVSGDAHGPGSGTVFKIDRGPAGERVAYVRLFRGTLRVRDRVGGHTVTGIEVFDQGTTVRRSCATGNEIAKVWGLGDVRIGDVIGDAVGTRRDAPASTTSHHPRSRPSSCPTPEDRPVPAQGADPARRAGPAHRPAPRRGQTGAASLALRRGAEGGDPGDARPRTSASTSSSARPRRSASSALGPAARRSRRCRGAGRSSALSSPASASASIRHRLVLVSTFRYEIELGSLPAAFMRAIAETVPESLQQGLHGWTVTDCVVTLTHSQYAPRQSHSHQGFSKAMSSIGSDFRLLTPLVLMVALRRAGTVVCEPIDRYELEIPVDVLPAIVPVLARLEAPPLEQTARDSTFVLTGQIRAGLVHALQLQVPELTRGEGHARVHLRQLPAGARHTAVTAPQRQQPAEPQGVPQEGPRRGVVAAPSRSKGSVAFD